MRNITTLEYVKKNPTKFLFSQQPTEAEILGRVVSSIAALGELNISISVENQWCFIVTSNDWMVRNFENLKDKVEIFSRIIPLPELGEEQCRAEVFIYSFSDNIVIKELDGNILNVKGQKLSNSLVNKLSTINEFVVGFKPCCSRPI